VLDLDNQFNWKFVFDQERVSQNSPSGGTFAIPAFELPNTFTEHILSVRVTSKSAQPHWRFAGNLYQRVSLGLRIPSADATTIKMPLNRPTLIVFPRFNKYQLNFVAAYWLTHIRLTIWKYIGPEDDVLETMIKNLQNDVSRLEEKIDDISNYGY